MSTCRAGSVQVPEPTAYTDQAVCESDSEESIYEGTVTVSTKPLETFWTIAAQTDFKS